MVLFLLQLALRGPAGPMGLTGRPGPMVSDKAMLAQQMLSVINLHGSSLTTFGSSLCWDKMQRILFCVYRDPRAVED